MYMRFSDAELGKLYFDYRGKEYSELREQFNPGCISRINLLNEGVPFLAKIEEFIHPHLKFLMAILDLVGYSGNNTAFKGENYFHIYDISDKQVIEMAIAVDAEITTFTDHQLIICS
jgi:hypothetical protein